MSRVRLPSDERRSRYLEIALGLFVEHGYNGVTMDMVVSAAGGSKATLYRYFESKDALFSAIVADLQATLSAAPPAQDVADLPLADGLRILGRATASAALSERAIVLTRLAVGEHSRFPELGRILFELAPERSYVRFKEYLAAKAQLGEVEVPDPQIAAEQFLAGLVGHQQLRKLLGVDQPTPQEIEDRVDAAVRMFLRTYAANS
jgi:AcrR family transcriptional regulator